MKRFVLTSSSVAAVLPRPEVEGIVVTESTWNDEAVAAAQGPFSPAQWYLAYAASKTEAERAVWDFYFKDQSRRPDLVVNTGMSCVVHHRTNPLTDLLQYFLARTLVKALTL